MAGAGGDPLCRDRYAGVTFASLRDSARGGVTFASLRSLLFLVCASDRGDPGLRVGCVATAGDRRTEHDAEDASACGL